MYRKVVATLAMAAWLAGASHAVAQVDTTVQAQAQTQLDAQAAGDLFRPANAPVDRIADAALRGLGAFGIGPARIKERGSLR